MRRPVIARRTIRLPKPIDDLVIDTAQDGESYSAAAARLIEAGARALRRGTVPAWIGAGQSRGPKDFARRYERNVGEAQSAPAMMSRSEGR
jgi:hypothetical protein